MPDPKPKKDDRRGVSVDLALPTNGFRESVFFNWFRIQEIEDGCFVEIGDSSPAYFSRIHSFLIPQEGIRNIKKSADQYISNFTVVPREESPMPKGERVPPQFVNYMRLAHSGHWAEIWFITIPIVEIVAAGRGDKNKAGIVGHAIAHSSFEIHQQFLLTLFSYLRDET